MNITKCLRVAHYFPRLTFLLIAYIVLETKNKISMNQLDIFSSKMENRHIGYKGLVTPEMLAALILACTQNNIPCDHTSNNTNISEIVYWVKKSNNRTLYRFWYDRH